MCACARVHAHACAWLDHLVYTRSMSPFSYGPFVFDVFPGESPNIDSWQTNLNCSSQGFRLRAKPPSTIYKITVISLNKNYGTCSWSFQKSAFPLLGKVSICQSDMPVTDVFVLKCFNKKLLGEVMYNTLN